MDHAMDFTMTFHTHVYGAFDHIPTWLTPVLLFLVVIPFSFPMRYLSTSMPFYATGYTTEENVFASPSSY